MSHVSDALSHVPKTIFTMFCLKLMAMSALPPWPVPVTSPRSVDDWRDVPRTAYLFGGIQSDDCPTVIASAEMAGLPHSSGSGTVKVCLPTSVNS